VSLPTWLTSWLRRTDRASSSSPAGATTADVPAGTMALGSGSMSAAGVSPKAALLDRALHAGLAVPAGFVVPDGGTSATMNWGRRPVAVRSAFGAEDGAAASMAGWFTSVLDVDPTEIAAAVATVRASADRHDAAFRRDVLVLEMVRAETSGVAFSEPGTYDDLVNVADGVADRLVSGEVEGDRLELGRLEIVDDGWQRRLQHLLHSVRTEFGDRPWDVEWADDGATCWLVQLRPISAAPLRNETLTAANHAEILPELPSHLMTSIIAEAGPDLFDWYLARVPGLPATRDFLHVLHGRPMINLSLLEDMMRHLGLPTRLVAESIGGGHRAEHPGSARRLIRQSPSLLRLGWAQIKAVVFAARNRRRAAAIGSSPASTFTVALDDLRRSYVALVTGMFPLSSAIGPPLSALRRAGTLYEHAARHRTITAELAARRQAVARAPDDQRAALVTDFLTEFGHRGVYESDIARPRHRDDPVLLTAGDPAPHDPDLVPATASVPRRTVRGVLTWPIWLIASQPLAARELLRHDAMRSFGSLRDSLVALATIAVERGQLRSVDDLWLLTADEGRRLDSGWLPDATFWSQRSAERAALAEIDVPHVVGRFDDPSQWSSADDSDGRSLHGLALTAGSITGYAWVLDEPAGRLPEGLTPTTTVLVARSIDAGWISTISQVAAVVVEIGGDLSHGSILVRELGIPAVTNVSGATRHIATGDAIRVHAGSGTVTRLDSLDSLNSLD